MDFIEFLRQFRINDYAIFDFAVAFLGIYLLSPMLSKILRTIKIDIPRYNWLFLTLPFSLVIHLLVGNITPMTRDFITMHDHYIVKILMVILLICGLRGIKIIKKKEV